ncbi:MAG: NAD(P)H-binding protein [Steroidobacteraceae bacterium]|nr:NAD(P)H-binding protein [Steroidobacteraceae bacterium]MDW8258659.1 NAD(P)H-binding protein [Gammaproteobacteria bacterium]
MLGTRRLLLAALMTLTLAACAATSGGRSQEVLVLGGTGQLGALVVRELAQAGHRVTVLTRANSDRRRLAGLDIGYLIGDATRAEDLAAALRARRFDSIVVALRVMDGDTRFYETVMRPLTQYARETGVRQIIHHGAVGAGRNRERFANLGWERVPGLFDRLADQGVGEQILRESGITYTIIRNARLYPDGTPSTGKAELTEDDSVLTPMTRADLAIFTRECLGNRACYNKTFHVRDDSLRWPPPSWQ